MGSKLNRANECFRREEFASNMTDATLSERSRPAIDCGALLVLGFVALAILRPLQNAPFIDDATYAWSVEWLLERGELRILDWAGSPNLTQILWGWLFCLPGGFSFSALRFSTFVLGQSGVCALYLLLRELDVERRHALLGAGVLAVNPVFFILQFTFMTDVAFVVLMVWSCFAAVRALQRKSDAWLLGALIFSSLAMGTRLIAAAIPVAISITLLLHAGVWGRYGGRFLIPLLSLPVLAVLVWWRETWMYETVDLSQVYPSPASRMVNLRVGVSLLPAMLPGAMVFTATSLGIALLPISLAAFRRSLWLRTIVIFLALCLVLVGSRLLGVNVCPFDSASIWSLRELGLTEGFLDAVRSRAMPGWWCLTASLLSLGSAALCLANLSCKRDRPADALLIWMFIGQFMLCAILWLFADRYALPMLPLAIALVFRGAAPRPYLALALLGLFGVFCLVGTRDHLAYNAAVWGAVERLRAQGVAASEIDGGYAVNIWLQYAHPENAPRDHGRAYVPSLTDDGVTLRYELSNQALPGQKLIATEPYRRWLAPSGKIYVHENPADSAAPTR
jgi:4-amino-4-deoxy-L-arabinose transferase-like glycosyltransferase